MNEVTVSCYSGHTFADRPVWFTWEGATYHVEAVDKEWREPGMRCFRVVAQGSGLYDLCYNEHQDVWRVSRIGGKEAA